MFALISHWIGILAIDQVHYKCKIKRRVFIYIYIFSILFIQWPGPANNLFHNRFVQVFSISSKMCVQFVLEIKKTFLFNFFFYSWIIINNSNNNKNVYWQLINRAATVHLPHTHDSMCVYLICYTTTRLIISLSHNNYNYLQIVLINKKKNK